MLITSSVLLSSSFVIILFVSSFDFSDQHNSFLRQFPPHVILEHDTLDVKYNSYYLAGGTQHHIYLGNYVDPRHLLVFNTFSADTQHVRIKFKNIDTLKYWSFRLKVDSPNFYLADGTIPSIFSGKVNNWEADRRVYDSAYFVEYTPIGPSSFAIRSLNSTSREHVLGKESTQPPNISFAPNLLQKQIDGIFCIDGMLHYDNHLSKIVYTYFYRNQFIVADSNMSLIYRGKTIDTVSRVKIKVSTINSSNTRTMSAPPMVVNGLSSVSNGYLFVNSKLLAKNEAEGDFNSASVIDVYNLTDGTYKLSFYVHDFNKKKMINFKVIDGNLLAIFDHYVIIYKLREKYFNELKGSNS